MGPEGNESCHMYYLGAVLAYDKQGFQVNYLGKDVNIEFVQPH